MADINELRLQLAEAEAAYHRLMTGQAVERVDDSGSSLMLSRSDPAKLRAYIAELRDRIARAEGRGGRRVLYVST